jgi:hypothetical protein
MLVLQYSRLKRYFTIDVIKMVGYDGLLDSCSKLDSNRLTHPTPLKVLKCQNAK